MSKEETESGISISFQHPQESLHRSYNKKPLRRPATPAAFKRGATDVIAREERSESVDPDDEDALGGLEDIDPNTNACSDDSADEGDEEDCVAEEEDFFSDAEDINISYAAQEDGPDGDDACSTTANTCSASIAETEEDFEGMEQDLIIDGISGGNKGEEIIKSPITRSQFPVGFGQDVLYFPKEGEKGNFPSIPPLKLRY